MKHHAKEFLDRFNVSAILTIPLLVLSRTIQEWFGYEFIIPYHDLVITVLATAIYLYGGMPFFKGAINELKRRKPGMMSLVTLGISAAYLFSIATVVGFEARDFFWEMATLVDIMLLGHYIEMKSIMGTREALKALAKLLPKTAYKVVKGKVIEVSTEELKKGDVVLVKPGQKVPVDGVVVEGTTHVDESMLTGESIPVKRKRGDEVVGGSVNVGGSAIKVKVTKLGKEGYIGQIMKIVDEAQKTKTKTQDLANKAAGVLFYIASLGGAIAYTYWNIAGFPDIAIQRAVTTIVIACPHALGLAIPLVAIISTGLSARKGILVKDKRAFEELRDVNIVVFDKTGTLTEGVFEVDADNKVLRYAASLEQYSNHMIAKTIIKEAKKRKIKLFKVKNFKEMKGKGVYGEIGKDKVYAVSYAYAKKLVDVEQTPFTAVYVIVNKKLLGVIQLKDRVRENAKKAIEELKKQGIEVYMLTGDHERIARVIAKELGIHYFAEVLPHQKGEIIEKLKQKGKVAMVGDGVNDAPSLAKADVGIAINAGTDVAIQTADVILVRNDPYDVVKAITLSKKTYRKMLENLAWATGYNAILLPLAMGVIPSIYIPPALGAVAMSLSTVIVAVNAQLLKLE